MTPSHNAINAYSIMWLYVMFDLPVETAAQRKAATRFRKDLLKDGFSMLQFSVYIRHCASLESATVHVRRIRSFIPDEGFVSVLKVTDKQFGETIHLQGRKQKPVPPTPAQLELF